MEEVEADLSRQVARLTDLNVGRTQALRRMKDTLVAFRKISRAFVSESREFQLATKRDLLRTNECVCAFVNKIGQAFSVLVRNHAQEHAAQAAAMCVKDKELHSATSTLATLEDELIGFQEKIKGLENVVLARDDEISLLKLHVQQLSTEASQLQARCGDLNEEVSRLNAHASATVSQYEDKLLEVHRLQATATIHLQQRDLKLRDELERSSKLAQQLEECQAEFGRSRSSNELLVQKLKDELSCFQAERQSQNVSAAVDLRVADAQIESLRKELSNQQAGHKDRITELQAHYMKQIEGLNEQLLEAHARDSEYNKGLSKKFEEMGSDLVKANNTIAELEKAMADMAEKAVADSRGERSEKHRYTQELRSQIQTLTEQVRAEKLLSEKLRRELELSLKATSESEQERCRVEKDLREKIATLQDLNREAQLTLATPERNTLDTDRTLESGVQEVLCEMEERVQSLMLNLRARESENEMLRRTVLFECQERGELTRLLDQAKVAFVPKTDVFRTTNNSTAAPTTAMFSNWTSSALTPPRTSPSTGNGKTLARFDGDHPSTSPSLTSKQGFDDGTSFRPPTRTEVSALRVPRVVEDVRRSASALDWSRQEHDDVRRSSSVMYV